MKKAHSWMGRRLRARAVVIVGTAALTCLLAVPASGAAATWTFHYTGGMQTWVVPAGVTAAHFDIYGAAGGEPYIATFNPGKGGRARAELPLTPGSTVHIAVGGRGGYPEPGYNGGGRGGQFGGGGATDIRIGGTGLNHRVLVAGGGGGAGQYSGNTGGDGGGLTGTAGSGAFGGGGGTQTAGGSGTYPTWDGSFGQGGGGGNRNATGGGGGGWYGGAGGPGGGGGGSGYGPSGTDFRTGVSGGNGSVTITVLERPPTGAYHGSSPHGPIAFHLSHDYATVTNFTVGGQVLLHMARFHFGGTDPGSFSGWQNNWHVWAHWSGDRRGHVSGGYSHDIGGHTISWSWSAVAPGS
jgi:Glycine rich protein